MGVYSTLLWLANKEPDMAVLPPILVMRAMSWREIVEGHVLWVFGMEQIPHAKVGIYFQLLTLCA